MAAALRYLALRDRTESQVTAFLTRRGFTAAIPPLLRRLRSLGYLNDGAYAKRWAAARIARRPMGRARMEAELIGQGLARSLVLSTLDEVYRGRSEQELAQALLRQRGRSGKRTGPSQQARLLQSHGFSEETIEEVVGS
jgi:regulatory protein